MMCEQFINLLLVIRDNFNQIKRRELRNLLDMALAKEDMSISVWLHSPQEAGRTRDSEWLRHFQNKCLLSLNSRFLSGLKIQ